MAKLPPDGPWTIQQIDGEVVLFHCHTEEELVRFDPALKVISLSPRFTLEQKAFAAFWTGYFYAHATPKETP